MKVFLKTYGCQMNVRDSDAVAGMLIAHGYSIAEAEKDADIIIFNTCSVRENAEHRALSNIGALRPSKYRASKRKPQIIGVIGCMAQNYKAELFERMPHISFIAGPGDISKIPHLVAEAVKKNKRLEALSLGQRPESVYKNTHRQDKNKTYVNISEGCDNYCSYCIVPYVRGSQKDRQWDVVVDEIKALIRGGNTKISLLGQNVNSYCGGISFAQLLAKINDLPGIECISFMTSHPKDASSTLFKAMAGLSRVSKNLHLPVQSGSDSILKLMNRKYTSAQYVKLADEFRSAVKDGRLSTDIIVGFPGETEEDFQATLNLMKKVKFDAAYIFKYSPRPGTKAAELLDDVPLEEKERRHRILLDYQRGLCKKIKK